MQTKVLLVDDHLILREGLAVMLKQIDWIEIVGSIGSGEEAVSSLEQYNPHVILMDILMGGMNGLEATRWIKEQKNDVKIIIISSEIKKEYVSLGIKCGIDGYISKSSTKAELIDAIQTVMNGEKYFIKAITNLIFEDFYTSEINNKTRKLKVSTELTKRENEILRLVAEGKSNQNVADELFISVKTVETHKTHILEKLGLRNTAELVKYAIKNNIISV